MVARQRIKVKGKSRYVVRTADGKFKDNVNIGKSIRADSRKKSKTKPKKTGYGHKGDY